MASAQHSASGTALHRRTMVAQVQQIHRTIICEGSAPRRPCRSAKVAEAPGSSGAGPVPGAVPRSVAPSVALRVVRDGIIRLRLEDPTSMGAKPAHTPKPEISIRTQRTLEAARFLFGQGLGALMRKYLCAGMQILVNKWPTRVDADARNSIDGGLAPSGRRRGRCSTGCLCVWKGLRDDVCCVLDCA